MDDKHRAQTWTYSCQLLSIRTPQGVFEMLQTSNFSKSNGFQPFSLSFSEEDEDIAKDVWQKRNGCDFLQAQEETVTERTLDEQKRNSGLSPMISFTVLTSVDKIRHLEIETIRRELFLLISKYFCSDHSSFESSWREFSLHFSFAETQKDTY